MGCRPTRCRRGRLVEHDRFLLLEPVRRVGLERRLAIGYSARTTVDRRQSSPGWPSVVQPRVYLYRAMYFRAIEVHRSTTRRRRRDGL